VTLRRRAVRQIKHLFHPFDLSMNILRGLENSLLNIRHVPAESSTFLRSVYLFVGFVVHKSSLFLTYCLPDWLFGRYLPLLSLTASFFSCSCEELLVGCVIIGFVLRHYVFIFYILLNNLCS